jgi:1-acyl-sn-glycerol-3-phosphate acyltransferase
MIKGSYKVLKVIFSKPLLWLFGMKVVGAENEPRYEDGSYLLCANHLGALDPFCIAAALNHRKLCFMAKKELFKNKLAAKFFSSLGAYPIDRSGADVGAVKGTIRLLQDGHCTAIFPQGTRCPRVHPSQTKIKSGAGLIAARAGVPVLPVLIRNRDWRVGLFHRTEIVIGKLIMPEEFMPQAEGERANYAEVSRLIFDRICTLEDQK